MTIGEKIIGEHTLSIDEAETVYHSIQELYDKGAWHTPGWSIELAEHLNLTAASAVVLSMAWRAVAIAYRQG